MSRWGFREVAGLALVALGCQSAPTPEPIVEVIEPVRVEAIDETEPIAGTLESAVAWNKIGASREGRDILEATFGSGPDTILLLASIHGNEAAGTPLLKKLAAELLHEPAWLEGRRVVIVPVVNPDGLARSNRANARGVDLNRNFPADNWKSKRRYGTEPLSEPESCALFELIERTQPNRIITLHQPASLLDYDGPAEELAQAMADMGPLRVKRMGARPGSLGSYVGLTLGLPIVTVELPRPSDRLDKNELWAKYGAMLRAAITFR